MLIYRYYQTVWPFLPIVCFSIPDVFDFEKFTFCSIGCENVLLFMFGVTVTHYSLFNYLIFCILIVLAGISHQASIHVLLKKMHFSLHFYILQFVHVLNLQSTMFFLKVKTLCLHALPHYQYTFINSLLWLRHFCGKLAIYISNR